MKIQRAFQSQTAISKVETPLVRFVVTASRHVNMLWTPHKKSKQRSMAVDLFTTNRKATQQIEKLLKKSTANPQLYDKSYSLLYKKCTANPQQIEQVEFELKASIFHQQSVLSKKSTGNLWTVVYRLPSVSETKHFSLHKKL
jgi:hypothetical protein